jgi:hypothetical protein
VFVFVKQFRPPVFLTRVLEGRGRDNQKLSLGELNLDGHIAGHLDSPNSAGCLGHLGVTLELCAGIVDKVCILV